MPAVTNGAELIKKLKESGTPDHADGPLTPARACLIEIATAENRMATGEEVARALERHLGPDHGTCRKARALATTGELPTPKGPTVPIEDVLLERFAARPDEKKVEPKKAAPLG